MILATTLAALPVSTAARASTEPTQPAVEAVKYVDLGRYVGKWYEVARIPNRFQKQCARGTSAEYSMNEDGRISVVNRCFKEDGSRDEAKGVAKVVDAATHAKLKVSFVSFLGWRPFWGDYWVIGLDEDYRWAVVGTPDRKFGWILARSPTLSTETLDRVFEVVEANGYAREAFKLSAP